MNSSPNILMWFRADLRVEDNAALSKATHDAHAHGGNVIAVFLLAAEQWKEHDWAGVRVDFALRHLSTLRDELSKLNIPLLIIDAPAFTDAPAELERLARTHACGAAYWNKEYEINERRRDDAVARQLESRSIRCQAFTDQTLVEPGDVRTGNGTFFTVFSPFKRALYKHIQENGGLTTAAAPKKQRPFDLASSEIPSEVRGFRSHVPAPEAIWPAGERHARKQLVAFVERSILSYKSDRDCPSLDATSKLSPYLAIGSISARQCILAALEANRGKWDSGSEGAVHWISEVAWREFYKHILIGFPRVCMGRAFRRETDRIRWEDNTQHFQAWCQGRTGVPIVDAGIRQLLATGWMHNRVRMITAMYLTKDLFINWRWGEKFFMQHLIDGDLASNNGGWQWSASTGTDAAPYFRIFNPYSQSRTNDPGGHYIRTYVPELADLDGGEDGAIHDPSQLPDLLRGRIDYPNPIVDRTKTKDRVMSAFQGLTKLV